MTQKAMSIDVEAIRKRCDSTVAQLTVSTQAADAYGRTVTACTHREASALIADLLTALEEAHADLAEVRALRQEDEVFAKAANDEVVELRAELDRLQALVAWRTDWENAPKDGTQILAKNHAYPVITHDH